MDKSENREAKYRQEYEEMLREDCSFCKGIGYVVEEQGIVSPCDRCENGHRMNEEAQ